MARRCTFSLWNSQSNNYVKVGQLKGDKNAINNIDRQTQLKTNKKRSTRINRTAILDALDA